MAEKNWSDLYRGFLQNRWGETPTPEVIRERYGWAEELHARAAALLAPEALAAEPAAAVYAKLRALSLPRCPIRVTNLGRENRADEVVESLRVLMETKGDFAAKYRAAKIPQVGRVTVTELLSVAKPRRFMIRNAAVLRGAAKVVPFYTRRGLEEMPYPEFLDLCRELCRVQETLLDPAGLRAWAEDLRYLLLYAILTEKG